MLIGLSEYSQQFYKMHAYSYIYPGGRKEIALQQRQFYKKISLPEVIELR